MPGTFVGKAYFPEGLMISPGPSKGTVGVGEAPDGDVMNGAAGLKGKGSPDEVGVVIPGVLQSAGESSA